VDPEAQSQGRYEEEGSGLTVTEDEVEGDMLPRERDEDMPYETQGTAFPSTNLSKLDMTMGFAMGFYNPV